MRAHPPQRRIHPGLRNLALALTLSLTACDSGPAEFQKRAVVEVRLERTRERASEEGQLATIAAETLLSQVENSPHAWMRAQSLKALQGSEHDWVVPRLLLRLKLERNELVRIELARTLARQHNWAGLDALFELSTKEEATTALAELATSAGAAGPNELWRLWNHGDLDERLPRTDPSPKHESEVWESISKLAGEQRSDAIFVLSNCDVWVAHLLAETLHEAAPGFATGAARSLSGMGVRGNVAGPDLLLALGSPELAVDATTALGMIGYPLAAEALVRRLGAEFELELRIAAATALASLSVPETFSALEQHLAPSEPDALRIAVAKSLVQVEGNTNAARVALEFMRSSGEFADRAETILETWILRDSTSGESSKREALARWHEPAGPPGLEPTDAESAERRKRRGVLVAELLEALTQ